MHPTAPAVVLALASTALGQLRSDGTRAYTAELAADAALRTSALQDGPGAFSVDVHGFTQFRYIWTSRDDADNPIDPLPPTFTDDDDAVGFQTARTRISVSGHVINESWDYFIDFGFDRGGGGAVLENAYAQYKMDNGWSLLWGQFKAPLLREEMVAEKFQLAIDRSPTSTLIGQSRTQGVQLGYEGDQIRFLASFNDGLRTINSDYTSNAEADWALSGRLEYKWAGEWKQFRDFTSFPESEYAGMAGLAAHIQDGGDTVGTFDRETYVVTADASMEGSGWNIFAAAIYRNTEIFINQEAEDWGWLVQGGYFLTPKLELFARFDMVIPDGDNFVDDEFGTLTGGVNYYVVPESHAAKVSAEVIYFFEQGGAGVVPTNTLTPLIGGDEGQFSLVTQFQLVF